MGIWNFSEIFFLNLQSSYDLQKELNNVGINPSFSCHCDVEM